MQATEQRACPPVVRTIAPENSSFHRRGATGRQFPTNAKARDVAEISVPSVALVICAFCGPGYPCLPWPWLSVPSVALVIRAFRGPGYPCLLWPWLSVPSVALVSIVVICAFCGPGLHCRYPCLLWPWC